MKIFSASDRDEAVKYVGKQCLFSDFCNSLLERDNNFVQQGTLAIVNGSEYPFICAENKSYYRHIVLIEPIYDSKTITKDEVKDFYTVACYFGNTEKEVEAKERAGILIRYDVEGFEFAGIRGNFRFLQPSAELSHLMTLVRKYDNIGKEMINSYYSFMRGID